MNKATMKTASNEQLVSRYEQLAIARGRALWDNDPRSANHLFSEETAIRHELTTRVPSAISLLLSLLKSADPWVRLDSAAPALFFAPDQAEPVLELLAKEPKALGITAWMTLDQWRQGKLKPQW
jgi:hypothetical protein